MRAFDASIRQFLSEASSSSPTPGGGSIAALMAALGASMGSMTAILTSGAKFAEVQDEMRAVVEQMRLAMADFEVLLEEDIASFQQYMDALRLPKSSPEERRERSLALQEAALRAAQVPLRLMERCLDVLQVLERSLPKLNRSAISDAGIAAIALEAAVQSAWLTVEINLNGMKEEAERKAYQEKGTELLARSEQIKQNVLRLVRESMTS